MKTRTTIIYLAFTLLAFAPATNAQCPQICDGSNNVAFGGGALFHNSGLGNTAIGADALVNNTTGYGNTANGAFALGYNTTGTFETATGSWALFNNTTGNDNTANGWRALYSNTTGVDNTARRWFCAPIQYNRQ